jgi:F0F1-type ATP synthase epsilon subunit
MAAKKVGSLSKLTFNELKDKVKDIEGFKSMNRFEITVLARKAENLPELAAEANPRAIKPEILGLKAKLAETGRDDKKARKDLRRAVARLKRNSRKYFA